MWDWLNETLLAFRDCFRRKAAFRWFVVVVVGLMTRADHLGVTSIIRELCIDSRHYEKILHFFHAGSWGLCEIVKQWTAAVKNAGVLHLEEDLPILVGDGTKQSKEGRKMPCVKRHFQESENSGKPTYIFGHLFGAIGVLIGNGDKLFCAPLSMSLQGGNRELKRWSGSSERDDSHVVRIIRDACSAASVLSTSILLLDRYFLTAPALKAWLEEEARLGRELLKIVTKAKINAVAYEKPERKTGRGRPSLKGQAVKLRDYFDDKSLFTETSVFMYGKQQTARFYCKDLLWGKGLYRELRFVLVWYGKTKSILVCTDTSFSPERIIRLYSYRFKIECCFRELKQALAGLSYHFWSKAMPELNRFAKTGEDILSNVVDAKDRMLILSAYKAIEGFVQFSCIAIGLLQICAVRFSSQIQGASTRWLRTVSNKTPSEATVADFMRKSIFGCFHFRTDLTIVQLIRSVQVLSASDHVDGSA